MIINFLEQTQEILQIDKFNTVVKIVYKLTFRTEVLRRSECTRDK